MGVGGGSAVPNVLIRIPIPGEAGAALFTHSAGLTGAANRQGFNTSLKIVKSSLGLTLTRHANVP